MSDNIQVPETNNYELFEHRMDNVGMNNQVV